MQESSFRFGLRYVIAALSLYDEYSNDILDMPEGTCFPRFVSASLYLSLRLAAMLLFNDFTHLVYDRPQYRKNDDSSLRTSGSASVSRPSSFKKAPSRSSSIKNNIAELKSLEVFAHDSAIASVCWNFVLCGLRICTKQILFMICAAVGWIIQGMLHCRRKIDF